jgi:hypothetical protein
MSRKIPTLKPRNRHAINPILRKAGCHEKSPSALRTAARRALARQLLAQSKET